MTSNNTPGEKPGHDLVVDPFVRSLNRSPSIEGVQFDGEMSSEVELWLGEAFNSWLPSRRGLEVKTSEGLTTVREGDFVVRDAEGVRVLRGEAP